MSRRLRSLRARPAPDTRGGMRKLLVLIAVLCLALAPRGAWALADDPRQALLDLDANARVFEQIRYGAVRVTTVNDTRTQERWFFASEGGGHFRVDYVGDTTRQLVCDGAVLWDYVPAMRAAQRVELSALSAEERAATVSRVLGKVALPGVRTGLDASGMTDVAWGEDGAIEGRPTRTINATDARGGKLSYTLDAERGYLVASRIEENGEFLVSVESLDHREVAPGVWVPYRVVSTSPALGGKVRAELQLNQVAVGQDLPDTLFEMKLDPSVQVRRVP